MGEPEPAWLPPNPQGIDLLPHSEAEWIRKRYPTSWRGPKDDPDGCVTCRGKGEFLWYEPSSNDDSTKIAKYTCPCVDQWIMHRYFLHAGIGLSYQRMSWRMVRAEKGAVDLTKQWREYADRYVPAGVGLILHGSIGTGKTMLAALLLKELLADGWDGYFVTFSSLIDEFASGWRDEEQKRWFRDRITNADILVVDDVGRELKQRTFVKEKGTEDRSRPLAIATMDEVLRYRVAHSRPTIITTNMTEDDLTSDYGSNIMSLLNEKSATYEFTGNDYRPTAYSNQDEEIQLGLTRPVVVS